VFALVGAPLPMTVFAQIKVGRPGVRFDSRFALRNARLSIASQVAWLVTNDGDWPRKLAGHRDRIGIVMLRDHLPLE
jgi:hypothetical protein